MDLGDEQRSVTSPLIPEPRRRTDSKEDRPLKDCSSVINDVQWILQASACWHDLSDMFPPYQICHRRLQYWIRSGIFENVLQRVADDLRDHGGLDLSECFIDSNFVVAEKRVSEIGAAKRLGKGMKKVMAISDGAGHPVAIDVVPFASPHGEVISLLKRLLPRNVLYL